MLIPAGDLVFRADSYRQETGVGGEKTRASKLSKGICEGNSK